MPIRPDAPLTAKIVEWDDAKGYGFLQVGKGRVFLHRREFTERHKRPAVGDVIQFIGGVDAKGRVCAKNAVHVNDGGRITVLVAGVLACLLVLPALALQRCGVNFRWAGAYVLVMGAISYGSYALDKRRARAKEWRISEAGLHVTELLGGWPGAFLAQRRLRHKVSKRGYQMVFWLIVGAYQFTAFDSLRDWQVSRAAWNYIGRTAKRAASDFRREQPQRLQGALQAIHRLNPVEPVGGGEVLAFPCRGGSASCRHVATDDPGSAGQAGCGAGDDPAPFAVFGFHGPAEGEGAAGDHGAGGEAAGRGA